MNFRLLLPSNGPPWLKTFASSIEDALRRVGSAVGGAAWGDVTGTLSDQTDLQTALNGKQATLTGTGDVPGLTAALAGKTATTRSIATTAPLTGGGDLSADRTFAISAATTGAAGSMSAADKMKLDLLSATGTSFPGSPATGDLYTRSDRGGITYRYDGTRWLSTQLFTTTQSAILTPAAATTTGDVSVNPWAGKYDIYLEDISYGLRLTGSGNWTVFAFSLDAGVATNFTGYTTGTAGDTSSNVAIGAIIASTSDIIGIQFTENSGTATVQGGAALHYRLIG